MTRLRIGLVLVCLAIAAVASAQSNASPTSKLAWDQAAPDLATAQAYTYKAYPDGTATGAALSPVTCSGASSPFVCTVPFPAFAPGPHTMTVSAGNEAGDSLPSAALSFSMVVIPAVPVNLRIQ